MEQHLVGWVEKGLGLAGDYLEPMLPLIEARSGLTGLIPNTLNVRLPAVFRVTPDFIVTKDEYGLEELRFQHCEVHGVRCLILRPETHEVEGTHGPSSIELMSAIQLRDAFGLSDGSPVTVKLRRP